MPENEMQSSAALLERASSLTTGAASKVFALAAEVTRAPSDAESFRLLQALFWSVVQVAGEEVNAAAQQQAGESTAD